MTTTPAVPEEAVDDFSGQEILEILAATGVRLFEIDANRNLTRLVPPNPAATPSLLARDVRGFVDPLAPFSEHAEIAHAIAAREPFKDLLIPINVGTATRTMRVSGNPRFDEAGVYRGCRGIAVDAGTPKELDGQMSPQLRQSLANALGLIVGLGQFLQQDMPIDRRHVDYLTRLLAAAGTARNIVAASSGSPAPTIGGVADPARDPHEKAGAPNATHKRILLVHETPEVADLIAIALDRTGFETAVCRDAAEAFEVLLEDKTVWDVLITTAGNASIDGTSLIGYAKGLRAETLYIVCDQPDPQRRRKRKPTSAVHGRSTRALSRSS